MLVLAGSPPIFHEYDAEMFITTDLRDYNFDAPYTLHFDGAKVFVYHYTSLRTFVDGVTDLKIDDIIIRILVGKEIGVAENYVRLVPDIFLCFEKTSYPSKFFYRKAQMWIGSQISGRDVFGTIVYNGIPNRMLFSVKSESGIVFEGTSHAIFELTHVNKRQKV